MDSLPGTSMKPTLRGEKEKIREEVVVYEEYGPVRMIRSTETLRLTCSGGLRNGLRLTHWKSMMAADSL